jgi:hypothetical protein
MNSRPHILRVSNILLALIISGCVANIPQPTAELESSAQMEAAIADSSESALFTTPWAEDTPTPVIQSTATQVPQPASTQVLYDPYPGWESYTNDEYHFAFRYPTAWALEEESNLLMLSQETLLFAVAFQHQDETAPFPWTGMSAGDLESRGKILFLGQEIDKNALVYEGKIKALTYTANVDDLLFSIRLDDMAGTDYQAIELSNSTQDEIDRILASFERR